LNLAGVHLGLSAELAAFGLMAVGGGAVTFVPRRAAASAPSAPRLDVPDVELEPVTGAGGPSGRLIGRIARTTSEFANGVGRVWIDGSEWSAELDGQDTLGADAPVRVLGVSGGVRLRVRTVLA